MEIKTNFYEYLGLLQESYKKEDSYKIILLKSAMVLYPILCDLGIRFQAPVALVCESMSEAKQILEDLCGLQEISIFCTNDLPKEVGRIIEDTECEFLSAFYLKGRNSLDNLKMLKNICEMGIYKQKKFDLAVMAAFQGEIPYEAAEFLGGKLYIHRKQKADMGKSKEKGEIFLRGIIQCVMDYYDIWQNTIKGFQQKHTFESYVEQIFMETGTLLEIFMCSSEFTKEEINEEVNNFRSAMINILDDWEISVIAQKWSEVFVKELYLSVPNVFGILNRHRIGVKDISNAKKWPLFDDDFYYITEELFSDICMAMKETIGVNQIKQMLESTGILKGEGKTRKYRTVQVKMVNEYGGCDKQRRVRLVRSKIDIDGRNWKEEIEKNLEKYGCREKEKGSYPTYSWSVDDVWISPKSINHHFLLVGQSGSGKTVALQKIEKRITQKGGKVLVLNYNHTHDFFKDKKIANYIDISVDGIPVSSLMNPIEKQGGEWENIEEVAERLRDVICSVWKFGDMQKNILSKVCYNAVAFRQSGTKGVEAFCAALNLYSNSGGEEIFNKIRDFITKVMFESKKQLWEDDKITVLDLSGLSEVVQPLAVEFVCSALWAERLIDGNEEETYFVFDEFQALKFSENSVLKKILREGRKFHISLLLATQSLLSYSIGDRALLQQAGTKLYFRLSESDKRKVLEELPNADKKQAEKILGSLNVGECLPKGNLLIGEKEGEEVMKISFRENNI